MAERTQRILWAWRYRIAFTLSLIVGVALRVWVAFAAGEKHWSDSAIIGLMAMHSLRGHFYPFYWGQAYMGSIESLGVVPFFALFGVSGLTLCLGLLPWYVLFTVALYLVVRRAGGSLAACIVGWLSAFAPPYLQYQETMPRGDYPETLAFGTLLLWLALRTVHEPMSARSKEWHLLAIGLVAGLAYWTNWLVFPYFAVVGLYLLLDDWRLPFRPATLGALTAFFVGSLPFWLFNLRYGFPTFSFLETLQEPAGRAISFRYAVEGAIPQLLGFRDINGDFTYGWPGRVLIWIAAIGSIGMTFGLWRSWVALARGRIRETSPITALLLLAFAMVAIYTMSLPGRFHVARYLLPLTTTTLSLTALAIGWIAQRSKPLAGIVLCGLLAFYGAQLVEYRQGFVTTPARAGAGPVEGLSRYLLRAGIKFGYADYGDATITTFLTGDRVVLTDYHVARYPLDEVDFHDPALIVRDGFTADATLKALDAEFSVKRIPGYRVYWPIRYDGIRRAPLSRRDWRITANVMPQDASLAIDGDQWSYWSAPPRGDHPDDLAPALTLDLGSAQSVSGLSLDSAERGSDSFQRLRIEVSDNGEEWRVLQDVAQDFCVYFDEHGQILTRPVNIQYVFFQPVLTRWLRFTLLEGTPGYNWSVGELTVFGAGHGPKLVALPEFADPSSTMLTERRLRWQIEREPGNDAPLLALRRLYGSLGEREKVAPLEQLEAARFRPAVPLGWRFGTDLELLGYDWRVLGPRRFEITYYWKATRPMSHEYAAYVRFTGAGESFRDDCLPGAPHTTPFWQPGEIVKQSRTVVVPETAPNGVYVAKLGVWIPKTKRHVRLGAWGWWGPRQRALLSLQVDGERVVATRN